ncbi:MAG: hypothetical protein HUU38_03825 [Anaerolineales bacterium]|nr:hypothetical protein [Anaerolineales bacterium]
MADAYEKFILSISADEYWKRIVESGWLECLPLDKYLELEENVRQAFLRNPLYAHSSLAVTIVDSEFCSEHPYKDLLEELESNSFGQFQPRDIREVWKDDHFEVAFTLDNQLCKFTANNYADYYDDQIIHLINTKITEQGITSQFLTLPASDQCFFFVFVNPDVYRKAQKLKVIPPQKFFLIRDGMISQNLDQYLRTFYEALEK